ncbi:MAG TPA: hypothetical protein VF789_19285 [Thermoanaerobaculia bacterium]
MKPFFSEQIAGGLLWSRALLDSLENARFGIICVTRENLHSAWLNFEAGSLWKRFNDGLPVCPLLFGVQPSELVGPLSLFQAKSFSEEGIKAICEQLADLTGLEEPRLRINFEAVWPLLQANVESDLSLLREGSTQFITISSPVSNVQVLRRPLVEGWIEDPSAEVWVVIHPKGHENYWVQPPVQMDSDGKWRTRVYIGRSGQEDVGVQYEIRAFANPEIEMFEDRVLHEWPGAEWSSPTVEVIRK